MGKVRVTLNETSQAEWQSNNLEYLRYEYDLKSSDVVIDIGAYRGEWASQIFCRYGCRLIVIEPGPWIHGFPIGQIINKSASDHEGVLKFGGQYYYSSEHEEPTHEYPCFDINSLLTKYDEIALVKINVEGGEYSLLDHIIEAGLHRRIRYLQVQFHCIEGEPYEDRHERIQRALSETHDLAWFYPFVWESWTRK